MTAPPAPTAAAEVFGDRLPLAERFAEWLTGPGLVRGLLGPREADQIWQRHLLNGVGIAAHIAPESVVLDLGSGAGLPGIPLLLARPDLRMVLVESTVRRCEFLNEVCADLGLPAMVIRARATPAGLVRLPEGLSGESVPPADVVTARAVASLADLARWAAPLLRPGGQLLAVKGASAGTELERDRPVLVGLGFADARVLRDPQTTSTVSADAAASLTPGSSEAATVVAATWGDVSRET
ncbi:MAG: 16S rRNA (guanine(527)-N(7))-methyltransferase RsmG [Actinomycetota bacterium]|nr:16S rRNA (guanine(527)-N(7))-methyltransferase RsmG [Actinomycetota bacterium]